VYHHSIKIHNDFAVQMKKLAYYTRVLLTGKALTQFSHMVLEIPSIFSIQDAKLEDNNGEAFSRYQVLKNWLFLFHAAIKNANALSDCFDIFQHNSAGLNTISSHSHGMINIIYMPGW